MLVIPDLGGEKDLLTGQVTVGYRPTDTNFIAINLGCVHMPIAHLESMGHTIVHLYPIWDLPGPKTNFGNGHTIA